MTPLALARSPVYDAVTWNTSASLMRYTPVALLQDSRRAPGPRWSRPGAFGIPRRTP